MKTASFFTFFLVSLISVSCREAEVETLSFDSSSNPVTETGASSVPENFSPAYGTLSIASQSRLDSLIIREKGSPNSDSTKLSNALECCGDHGQIPIKN